ncbi:hypothetical protein AT251_12545 [Enterovibrio nigricans]|uniref:Phospholipase_D-nuclease N-terminal n=1 Tax=Enterovibrio nigricans DSM 22720 TaxID=1121868 RepID=A0A1T4V3S0_9GAMM|nr:hypothetical protein AT251_12545 [Enterovibrio nigricans]SKA59595.1 hypothetical protein SAMN02745132_03152 [Enterovibrio nigricans DSM 22720]
MTVFDLIVVLIAGLITAFPLCRVAKKLGFKADWWIMLILVLIPFTQLIYLYFIAFKNSES